MPSYGPLVMMAEGPLLFIWKIRKRHRMMHAAPSMRMGLATAILTAEQKKFTRGADWIGKGRVTA